MSEPGIAAGAKAARQSVASDGPAGQAERGPAYRRVHIIVNPASGQDRPVLSILNDVFHPSDIDWDVFVTKEAGDARRYAQQAVEAGVDAVGVYGGDGTVMEVASALVGRPVPLAIFPGGTANVMSVELGIPSDPAEACALISRGEAAVRAIDVGQVGEHYFLTRFSVGLEANVIEQTDRAQKDRMGLLAYMLNGLRELKDARLSRYTIDIDGQRAEVEGLMCLVANSGILSPNSGIPGRAVLSFAPTISISDGLLDVLVIRRGNLAALLAVAAGMITGNENVEPLLHWQGREVTVESDPPQTAQLDGEMLGQGPMHVRVVPNGLRVIVPQTAVSPTATAADFAARDRGQPAGGASGVSTNGNGSGGPVNSGAAALPTEPAPKPDTEN
jgi:diacylglycerol kinase (ATP)